MDRFERGVDYLIDVIDGKRSFDWSLLGLFAFLAFGLAVTIHGCLFDTRYEPDPFVASAAYSDTVDGNGVHHCYSITEQDVYGGYTYPADCKNGRVIGKPLGVSWTPEW
jgi:hypothetical protein